MNRGAARLAGETFRVTSRAQRDDPAPSSCQAFRMPPPERCSAAVRHAQAYLPPQRNPHAAILPTQDAALLVACLDGRYSLALSTYRRYPCPDRPSLSPPHFLLFGRCCRDGRRVVRNSSRSNGCRMLGEKSGLEPRRLLCIAEDPWPGPLRRQRASLVSPGPSLQVRGRPVRSGACYRPQAALG